MRTVTQTVVVVECVLKADVKPEVETMTSGDIRTKIRLTDIEALLVDGGAPLMKKTQDWKGDDGVSRKSYKFERYEKNPVAAKKDEEDAKEVV